MNPLPRFYALEGLDGAGTTTQASLLSSRFADAGVPAEITAEPTAGRIGLLIREVLAGTLTVTPRTLAHLFAADRCEHLSAPRSGIEDRVVEGTTVVTDRYLFSSLAYQSVDCGFEYVLALNDSFALPEAVFYLDVSTEIASDRSAGRETREIFEHREFQEAVRNSYLEALAWGEANGVVVHRIDGALPANTIHEKIWNLIESSPIHKV